MASETPTGRVLKILVADDCDDSRFLVEAYLKGQPCDLTFAENGSEAVALAHLQTYDLILMDMQMPVMDGLAAAEHIRAAEKSAARQRVPLLALSANGHAEGQTAIEAAGCDGHLLKPISKQDLLEAIQRYTCAPSAQTPLVNIPPGMEEAAKRYLRSRKKDVPQMLDLLQSRDFNQIRVLAHNMKGTGTPYGFPDVSRLGKAIEMAAKEQNATGLSEQLLELSKYVLAVEEIVLSSQQS